MTEPAPPVGGGDGSGQPGDVADGPGTGGPATGGEYGYGVSDDPGEVARFRILGPLTISAWGGRPSG